MKRIILLSLTVFCGIAYTVGRLWGLEDSIESLHWLCLAIWGAVVLAILEIKEALK